MSMSPFLLNDPRVFSGCERPPKRPILRALVNIALGALAAFAIVGAAALAIRLILC